MRPLLQERHFNGGLCCLIALLRSAGHGLIFGVAGEHAVANRYIVIEPNARNARCGLVAHDFKVIGVALDDAAQRNQGVEVFGGCEGLQRERNFQRTGHRDLGNFVAVNAHFSERFFSTRQQLDCKWGTPQPITIRELLNAEQVEQLLDLPIHYPEVNGTRALRSQIAGLYPDATPEHVLVTVGAAEANQIICQTLLRPGDEVVVMEPGYRQVWGMAHNLGCEVRSFALDPANGWRPNLAALEQALSPRTRLIALVNPNNPTGAILTPTEMQQIAAAAQRTGAWLLADEVYIGSERLSDAETPSFWGMTERVVIVGSMSKSYGLSGLRLGWAVTDPTLIENLWRHHEYATIASSAPAFTRSPMTTFTRSTRPETSIVVC